MLKFGISLEVGAWNLGLDDNSSRQGFAVENRGCGIA
jgi:hypothetical protein